MKTNKLVGLLLVACALFVQTAQAQDRRPDMSWEKMQDMQIDFMAQSLSLSDKDTEKLKEVYKEYSKEMRTLMGTPRRPKKEKKNGDKINFSDIGRHSWERIRANRLAAVACCIHAEGKSVFQGMFGSADIAMNDKPRKETLYPIDVLNMPVAAVAALMMKERGQLDPDAPIRDGLSARALLRKNTPDALNALTDHIGTLANLPFEQFVQIMLFEPLKMKEAAYAPTEVQRLRTAQRYTVENDALLPVDAPALPALHGTLTDAMRFVQMIANGGELDGVRILEADNAALLLPLLTDEPVLSMHKGGTYLHVDPERKLCAVYLTNMVDAADAAEEFRTDMLAALKK